MPKSINPPLLKSDTSGVVSRDNFVIIPHDVIRDLRLSPFSVRLYGAIDARQGQKHSQAVYRKLLAADLGVSVRTVSRGIAELVKYGYLEVQLRGWASRYYLKNTSRVRGSSQIRQGVMPNMAPPQINNSLINNQNTESENSALEPLDVVVVEVSQDNYEKTALKVITAETGVFLQSNATTKKHLERAQRLGESPHDYGKRVSQHFLGERTRKKIFSESGFIVAVSMKAILEGDTPKEPLNLTPTPIPPKYEPNTFQTCEHGSEVRKLSSGLPACPQCRAAAPIPTPSNALKESPLYEEKPLFEQVERVS